MNGSKKRLTYELKNIQNRIKSREPARSGAGRAPASEQARMCESTSASKYVSPGVNTLTQIMNGLKEDRRLHVRLFKRHKIKFRRNCLWDKKQRNGKVICLDPITYQKNG
ncbi:MAG: hypothetical protein CVU62_02365 [Deltaproteobacteria bacterium HGW-Deltaproteobacteria-2]|jgi:hypothetical protein|nr:MAG: hypothetical protein CVU62_02365 [Deltaproteobacteria bacterium HGW-Deltaproteobacteria-2]